MVSGNSLTVVGNLVEDAELRFTANGNPVANFRVASTPRIYNKSSEQWEDGDPYFVRVTVWGSVAENVAESLLKGYRVLVIGRIQERHWEDNEGNNRVNYDLIADHVALDLQFNAFKRIEADRPTPRNNSRPAAKKAAAKRPAKKATPPRRTRNTKAVDEWEDDGEGYSDEPPF